MCVDVGNVVRVRNCYKVKDLFVFFSQDGRKSNSYSWQYPFVHWCLVLCFAITDCVFLEERYLS